MNKTPRCACCRTPAGVLEVGRAWLCVDCIREAVSASARLARKVTNMIDAPPIVRAAPEA